MDPGLTLLYDGDCGFCRDSIAWLRARDRRGQLAFVPLGEPGALQRFGVSEAEAMRRLQAIAPDGRRWQGAHAVLLATSRLPGWGWLRALLGVPPIMWIAGHAYDAFAARRRRAPCTADSCAP